MAMRRQSLDADPVVTSRNHGRGLGAVARRMGGARRLPLPADAVRLGLNSGRSEFRFANMKTLSLSEAKMKLSSLVDAVSATDEEVVITKNGVPAAVLISPDEFESWRETVAIRFDHESMEELRAGLAALERGKSSLYTLEELFRD